MDYENAVKLPLEIQMWFLEQSGYFLKAKLHDQKYEAACVLFERVLCGFKKRELKGKLQVAYNDLIHQLESVGRWDFVKAACPYVIQCTSQVLSNRRSLGLSDRLSVAVTKLLSTFHWCFIDAPRDCDLDPQTVLYPANVIELFVQLLVPCAHEVHEQDLTFSLKCGQLIWQPLWKNQCPDIPSFKRPVLLERHKCKYEASKPIDPLQTRGVLTYFDLIVLRSLSSKCLSEESLSWSLAYILQILQSELYLFCNFSGSWSSYNYHRPKSKRNVAVQHSMPLLSSPVSGNLAASQMYSLESDPSDVNTTFSRGLCSEPIYVSDAYEQWFTDNGTINHRSVLTLVHRITQNTTLRLCETLLYTLHVLLELGVVNDTDSESDFCLETVVYCLLDLITFIGCCNNDSGMRGSKGHTLRQLSHDMFAKIASSHQSQLKMLTVAYIKNRTLQHIFEFLHSFTGLCFGKPTSPPQSNTNRNLGFVETQRILPDEASRNGSPSGVKNENEALLVNWICIKLLDKLIDEEKSCKERYRELVSKLLQYLNCQHPTVMRRMTLNGILNSFSKSSEKSKIGTAESTQEEVSKADLITPSVRMRKRLRSKLPFMRSKGVAIEEGADQLSDVSSPEFGAGIPALSRPVRSWKETSRNSAQSSKMKIGKGSKRPRYGTMIYGPVDEEDTGQVFLEDNKKRIDLAELLKGVKSFRFMSCFVTPGHLPETSLIGALMDLRAPVLARAAVLLECCYFVHLCNRGSCEVFSSPELTSRKDLAMMLYKWGITIGRKLDNIIREETRADDDFGRETKGLDALNRSSLYEADISLVSNTCPYTIKLLACQLLLEITSFLRDNYLDYLCEKDIPSSSSPRGSSDYVRKLSSSSTSRINKTLLLKVPLAPAIAVQDESGSSTSGLRKYSGYSRFGVSTSPKYQRKILKKTTKTQYLQGERRVSRPYKDNQHITSSFDEDNEIPLEATDFPWMNGIVAFIRCNDKRLRQSTKSENLLWKLESGWQNLLEGFHALYSSKSVNVNPRMRRSAVVGDLLSEKQSTKSSEKDPILNYLRSEVAGLQHAPFSVICKAALVTDRMQIMEVLPCAWSLLTHPDQHLASTSAAFVLIAGAKLESFVTSFIKKEMSRQDPNDRAGAISSFGILWKYRYNAVSKMEANGIASLKILPPKIEYTLPSPLIGRDPPSAADAPWIAGSPFPDEAEELNIIQTEWYFDEEKRLALKERQRAEKLRDLRKGFRLTSVPFSQEAGIQARRKIEDDGEDDTWTPQTPTEQCADAQELFPSAICEVALDIIRLLDDTALTVNKISVGSLAYQVVWQCLVEEPELLFRSVYEQITKADKQDEILLVLRKLIQQIPDLPPVAGTLLFNNLVGLIMYYSRTNKPGCQERISCILDVVWKLTPSVSDLFLKEMKQTLRKENCEHVFMVTANVPGIKEIRVAFNRRTEKFEVKEDMTFASLIEKCERRFDLTDGSFVLIDKHSGSLMEATRFIRDTYSFKRDFTAPVMKLEKMDPMKSYMQRQKQAFSMKLAEISRLNLSRSIFSGNPSQKHIQFLFLEFLKQNAFPRKAIEFEFQLCQRKGMFKELLGLEVILKDTWIKFVCLLLEQLCESTTTGYEIELFLNVLNGALLLLCENIVILRTCLAGFLKICKHFGHIFAVNGYRCILPTLLKAYSNHQDNFLVVNAIEFTIGQFLALHQNPFLLQLFASASPMVRFEVTQELLDSPATDHIPAGVLCKLLLSMDRVIEDSLDILSLVHGEKPVQAYDQACKIENVEFSMTDIAIRLAVTVIACEPRSQRGTEMLVIIAAILPFYLLHLKQQTESSRCSDDDNDAQESMTKELKQLRVLYNYLKVIIDHSKHLSCLYTSEFTDIQDMDNSLFDDDSFITKPTIFSLSWWSNAFGNVKSFFGWKPDHLALSEDIDRISVIDEVPISSEERKAVRRFCLPRMSLLYLVAEFLTNATARVKEIRYLIRRKISFPEIIVEHGQVSILTNVLTSVLSLAPKNQEILLNFGLQRFVLNAMPYIDWSDDRISDFAQIIQRVNGILQKSINHPERHEFISWEVLEIILRGINIVIWKQSHLSALPEVKELLDWCLQLILCESFDIMNYSFSNMAAKLAARLIQSNPDTINLPTVCNDYHISTELDRVERFLVNWLLPLCFRLGTGRYDYPRLLGDDVEFALSVILRLLSPAKCGFNAGSTFDLGSSHSIVESNYFTAIRTHNSNKSIVLSPKTYKILFLGLKILVVAFEDSCRNHWKGASDVIEGLLETNKDEPSLWSFIHFIVENRSPLLIYLLPIVAEKVENEENLPNEIRSCKTRIERDLWNPATCQCRGDVLRRLLDDLTDLKRGEDEIEAPKPLHPAPKGRIRSKSTHNDRSLMITKFDKEWENYDDPGNDSNKPSDQLPIRKSSSVKRVKIFTEPTIIGEEAENKDDTDSGEEKVSQPSRMKVLKRRPLLKRQSAEDDSEDFQSKEVEIFMDDQGTGNSERSQEKASRVFSWQRFNRIRKKDDNKSLRTRKRERWRRDNSYRYRQKMMHQTSFHEDEEQQAEGESSWCPEERQEAVASASISMDDQQDPVFV